MSSEKKTTIHDVAKEAGTSATTVSRVFNDTGYPISSELRQKVLAAAEKLNYSPSALARSLKSSSTKEIGIIVPNISNPFYAQTILGIEQAISDYNYNIILCNTFRHNEKEREYMQMLYDKRVMGAIVSAVAEKGNNVIEFTAKGMTFVLLDQKIEAANCRNINFDFREGARLATDYLLSKGHKKIALITTPITRWSRREIYSGYIETINRAAASIPIEPIVFESSAEREIDESVYENSVGRQMAQQYLEKNCDATGVLCVNDMVAFGFIQELHENNVNVPDDVSVVGFDDIPFAAMFSPALTTVRCSAMQIGQLAGRMLMDQLQGSRAVESNIKLEPLIVERRSVRDLN